MRAYPRPFQHTQTPSPMNQFHGSVTGCQAGGRPLDLPVFRALFPHPVAGSQIWDVPALAPFLGIPSTGNQPAQPSIHGSILRRWNLNPPNATCRRGCIDAFACPQCGRNRFGSGPFGLTSRPHAKLPPSARRHFFRLALAGPTRWTSRVVPMHPGFTRSAKVRKPRRPRRRMQPQ